MSIEDDPDFKKLVKNRMKLNGMDYIQAVSYCRKDLTRSIKEAVHYSKNIDKDVKELEKLNVIAQKAIKEREEKEEKERKEKHIEEYRQNLSEDIKSGRIIFKKEYQKVTPCFYCGCNIAYIFYTMDVIHHAKLSCARCGRMIKWMSKFDCKYQEDEL